MASTPNRPRGRSIKNLRMVWSFASQYRLQLACAALALLVAAAATSGVPFAFKLIIDKGFGTTGAGNTRDIARWFEYLLFLVAIMAIATAVRYYFVSWLGERTVADIRLAVHRNLLRLSPGFFEENRPAEITSRITVDTTIIEQVVGTTVSVALRRIGDGFRDQRSKLRRTRDHRARSCLGRVCRVQAGIADLATCGRARADRGGSRCETRSKHLTTHRRFCEFIERVVARPLGLAGFGHRNPSFRFVAKDTSTAERFRFAKRTVHVNPTVPIAQIR